MHCGERFFGENIFKTMKLTPSLKHWYAMAVFESATDKDDLVGLFSRGFKRLENQVSASFCSIVAINPLNLAIRVTR
jgi:hypothetical protein